MKFSQISGVVSGFGVVALGAIAYLTNPPLSQYRNYAGEQIAIYLKDNVCQNSGEDLPLGLGNLQSDLLRNYCKTLVDASQAQLGEIVSRQTSVNNYFFFSIYQTDIVLPEPFPRYSFETVGIFQQFYTYRAEKS
ncbi:DUF4359 domain-containing protein [Picosynechococcus sp. PCC 73109]|uniref:DUF4359 domain-containing protein n=1 Tax=Picosynechococcus sp. PCC 73109 TaxID=374982 RepID=UPI00074583BA|nr:DUF4359 domain-containing protein [Picosynechococcus sp. PCC 73109]AMA08882.1 hypothetical protein AWQ23_05895 [Picosynechococcus sp. PCC 73109]